jgi:hypothetical protein
VRRVGFLVRLFGPKLGTLAELDFDRSNKQIQIRLQTPKMNFIAVFLLVVVMTVMSFAANENQKYLRTADNNICNCSSNVCILVPPSSDPSFPCYQGNNTDATTCFLTDPLLQPHTTWHCSTCIQYNYPYYLRNDPIYTTMQLWSPTTVKPSSQPASSP